MNTDQKIVVFGIVAITICVLSTVVYNTYATAIRRDTYNNCLETNLQIATSSPTSYIPACYR